MKILDIISEQTIPSAGPPTDPEGFLKWYIKNKPPGVTVIEEPKGSWFAKQKHQYEQFDDIYKKKWGAGLYKAFAAAGIVVAVLQYHGTMLLINDALVKKSISPEDAVKFRNQVAGWCVISVIVPRLIASLASGLAGMLIGALLESIAALGGRAGAKAKLILGLGVAGVNVIVTYIVSSPTGQKYMAESIFLPIIAGGIGEPILQAWDWMWNSVRDKLPPEAQQKMDSISGTPELDQAERDVKASQQDIDSATQGWQERKAAERARNLDWLRKTAEP
jgi:hypothetical protein